ncbi:MAG: HAMP domain-containing protein [Phycisphaerales bacterium]|jgi:signal transduction histidine kinase|nr:HAMP domain-containing protein [Phycisphaerales bacterium]
MRIGIRTKLLVLLVLMALLPLIAALITITETARQTSTERYGEEISKAASLHAVSLRISLGKDIEKFDNQIQYVPDIVKTLGGLDKPTDPQVIEAIEASWGASSDTLKGILANDLSGRLRQIQASDSLIAEILVTDRFGVLVSATQQTGDYFQADEDWWRGAWDGGKGRIYTPPVNFDKSAGIWAIDVCIPIRDGKQVVGVAKLVLNITEWVRHLTDEKTVKIGSPPIPVSIMLVRRAGEIFYLDDHSENGHHASLDPRSNVLDQWYGEIAYGVKPGWRFTDKGMLQGYAPLTMPDKIGVNAVTMPSWSLVMSVPTSEALRSVYAMGFNVLWVGLAIIAVIFVFGMFLAERGLVRRIRWLGAAARNVTEGDLSHRIQNGGGLWRLHTADEIDELTDDFNRMISRVDKTHRMLTEANELKTNFIRVAGHELRTPVAYLIAMTKLLEKTDDPARLQKAIGTMGAKAQRLAEIIDSIFKLLPGQGRTDQVQYADVVLSEMLEEVYLDCKAFMDSRSQKFIIEVGDDLPVIRADRAKLCDVLENLIINAIKFSPDGGTIRLIAGKQLGGYVTITIEDQGPGIAAEDLPHVFDPFYSTRDVMKHSSGDIGYQKRGMGLGLAIVRHFVEMHGGTVHVTTSDKGSVFSVTIPVEPLAGHGEAD